MVRSDVQVVSSNNAALVTEAARPMLKAAVTRPRLKIASNCRLVFAFICTFHSKHCGIKAVTISHTQAKASGEVSTDSTKGIVDASYRR